jgi:hypothetical protein
VQFGSQKGGHGSQCLRAGVVIAENDGGLQGLREYLGEHMGG